MQIDKNIIFDTSTQYITNMKFTKDNDFYIVEGNYKFNRKFTDTFDNNEYYYGEFIPVKIVFEKNPKTLIPKLFLPNYKIPEGFEHVYSSNFECCIGTNYSLQKIISRFNNLSEVFENIIEVYLLSITHYRDTGRFPNGEMRHNEKGVIDSYCELFNCNYDNCVSILNYILHNLSRKEPKKGHHYCPCGVQKKYRDCHMRQVTELCNELKGDKMLLFAFQLDIDIIRSCYG